MIVLLGIDTAAQHIGVAADDGTVERVLGRRVLLPLEHYPRIENTIHTAGNQIHNMAVHQLGGETDIVRHDAAYALLKEGIA